MFVCSKVPESIRKKEARDAKVLKELKDRREKAKKERKEKRQQILERASKYHEEYESLDRRIIEEKRKAKKEGNIFTEGEPKIAFVVRIRGYVLNQI